MKASEVNQFITKKPEWKNELNFLRSLILECQLQETIKWGVPTYTWNSKNIVGLGAFKNYVGLWFFQGVFLKDASKKLINAQEGKTQAMRQWRFKSLEEMDERLIKAYIQEAIRNQENGKEIKASRNKALKIPEILNKEFKNDSVLNDAFRKFTLGKQREFTDYINEAKRIETKLKRLGKIIPMIKDGIGLNDKYR